MQLVIAAFATRSRDRTPRRCWSVPFACLLLVALLPLPTQAQTNIKTKINPKDGAVMVCIPEGEFIMGNTQADIAAMMRENEISRRYWFAPEQPQHRVYLDGYWIYKYEVTVAQYRKFCKATGHNMPASPRWGWKDNHPIINVSWNDATAYANWAGVRLPTEAQWEKAARGTDGRKFPWGNKWDASKCANSVNIRLRGPKPVGSYPGDISPYGAHDMAGNVCEWCADWFDKKYYGKSPRRNPTGPASGQVRALRGNSWGGGYVFGFRVAGRSMGTPGENRGPHGFRCVHGFALWIARK